MNRRQDQAGEKETTFLSMDNTLPQPQYRAGAMQAVFRVFRATDDQRGCDRYIEGHHTMLEAYGVTKVTSANVDWRSDPNTYLVAVESPDSERVYGGCRVQIRSERSRMPLEDAVAILDDRIYNYVDELGNHRVGEFCGLWNSKEMAGYGFGSMYLGRVAIAISPLLNIKYLMGLCSPATLRNSRKVGFEVVRDLGQDGTFYYPKEDLIATLLIISDLAALPHADDYERQQIHSIRANPVREQVEHGPRGEIHISVDVRV